jgi:hypothetical protein
MVFLQSLAKCYIHQRNIIQTDSSKKLLSSFKFYETMKHSRRRVLSFSSWSKGEVNSVLENFTI